MFYPPVDRSKDVKRIYSSTLSTSCELWRRAFESATSNEAKNVRHSGHYNITATFATRPSLLNHCRSLMRWSLQGMSLSTFAFTFLILFIITFTIYLILSIITFTMDIFFFFITIFTANLFPLTVTFTAHRIQRRSHSPPSPPPPPIPCATTPRPARAPSWVLRLRALGWRARNGLFGTDVGGRGATGRPRPDIAS